MIADNEAFVETPEDVLEETGYGVRLQYWRDCDNGQCRHSYEERRRARRRADTGEGGPRFNPAGRVLCVTHHCPDAMGWATPVLATCLACSNLGTQLDIC